MSYLFDPFDVELLMTDPPTRELEVFYPIFYLDIPFVFICIGLLFSPEMLNYFGFFMPNLPN